MARPCDAACTAGLHSAAVAARAAPPAAAGLASAGDSVTQTHTHTDVYIISSLTHSDL